LQCEVKLADALLTHQKQSVMKPTARDLLSDGTLPIQLPGIGLADQIIIL
jgi:hypothetical protein